MRIKNNDGVFNISKRTRSYCDNFNKYSYLKPIYFASLYENMEQDLDQGANVLSNLYILVQCMIHVYIRVDYDQHVE